MLATLYLGGRVLRGFAFVALGGDAANDNCADAVPIDDGATVFTTIGATTDGPELFGPCAFFGDAQANADVWFVYTATCTGTLNAHTCFDTGFDTRLAVYPGDAC